MIHLIGLPTLRTERSALTVIEKLPFPIKRVYYLHGIDPKVPRAGHAHRKLQRVMVAMAGRFEVKVDREAIVLEDPSVGLFIPPLAWVELSGFSDDAVCMVVASEEHDEADCIRDRDECTRLKREEEGRAAVAADL